jgi:hypothetical protein
MCLKDQAASAKCFDLGGKAALVACGLVLVEDAFVRHGVHHGLHLAKGNSAALALSPARTAFSTFLTAVRYLERSEVLAALILMS